MIAAKRVDYVARWPWMEDSRTPLLAARMEQVLAVLKTGPVSSLEIQRETGLSMSIVNKCLRELVDDGHKIERDERRSRHPLIYYMRGPGKHPCPDCKHIMRSTEPHYVCERCRSKRIAEGVGTWPWDEVD